MAPGARDKMVSIISVFLFRLGQMILLVGYLCFMIGITTNVWVVRPEVDYLQTKVDPSKVDVIKHFGIFTACKQAPTNREEIGECASATRLIHFVDNSAIEFVQALMVFAAILYFSGFILDVIQLMPIRQFRNFLAENRLVEVVSGIATVIGLTAMVIFAGEIKNKAELVPGQEDETVGWSFTIAIVGLSFCIIGLLMVTMFRHLPVSVDGHSQLSKGGSWLRIKNSNHNMSDVRTS